MIDEIWVSPSIHFWVGWGVVITTLLSLIYTLVCAIRNISINRTLFSVLLLAQLSLMLQIMIGIKLLDQGLGPLQLYIHYVGGVGSFFFYLLFYWLPENIKQKRWTAFTLCSLGFLFALMAFTIGSSYVPH